MIITGRIRLLAVAVAAAFLGGCMGDDMAAAKHQRPLSQATKVALSEKGMSERGPLLVRIYKQESELEVWKQAASGRYEHFRTYEICAWSGKLGPKLKEGDRQAPEGFYTVTPAQMNPNSSYHLSFNIGFPNTFDQAHGRTGKHLMVHGACTSAGCYAMTDDVIQEIYSLAREAFRGGQRDFQVQAYPFRMTPENMAKHADNPNMPFWRRLKEGSDHFEVTGLPPQVGVCDRSYVFNARPSQPGQRLDPLGVCPVLKVPEEIEVAVAAKQQRDEFAYQVALADLRNQEQMQAQASVMLAYDDSRMEEGSLDDYEGAQVQMAAAETAAPAADTAMPAAPAAEPDQAIVTGSISQRLDKGLTSVSGAVGGVWGRIVDFTRAGNARRPASDPVPTLGEASDEAVASETPGRSASRTELPTLSTAAFAAPMSLRDPFSVFGLFETVGDVSVPADTVSRPR